MWKMWSKNKKPHEIDNDDDDYDYDGGYDKNLRVDD